MKIAYGDLIGGVSGDMFVAALLDLGLSLNRLRGELKKIPTLQFDISSRKKTIHSLRASQFQVICPKHEARRSNREALPPPAPGSQLDRRGAEETDW